MERRRKILFYGDSNTYGYDPADYYDQRYPESERWTYLLQHFLQQASDDRREWEIISEGMNGRQIPNLFYDRARIDRMLGTLGEDDVFAVMLGTNDILLTMDPNADTAIRKMQKFLDYLTSKKEASAVLLIAPPYAGREGIQNPMYRRYREECRKMNAGFGILAGTFGTMFIDTSEWDIDLAADLVHFSEEGHRRFAAKMAEFLMGKE